MNTKVALDGRLIELARSIGAHKTKKEAVTAALREYIQRRQRRQILDLGGQTEYSPDYDYKAPRRKKQS
jgi:Arc/MetJ family transcription regulator